MFLLHILFGVNDLKLFQSQLHMTSGMQNEKRKRNLCKITAQDKIQFTFEGPKYLTQSIHIFKLSFASS